MGDCCKGVHSHETMVRQLLGAIKSSTSATHSASVGGATEVTLANVLTALQNGKEFDAVTVEEDLGGGNYRILREVHKWNSGTGDFDPPIYYDAGNNIVVPTGALKYLSNKDLLSQIFQTNESVRLAVEGINGKLVADSNNVSGYDVFTNAGNFAGDYRSITVTNIGSQDGTIDGKVFKVGQSVTFSESGLNNYLTINLPYDATGTEFAVNYIQNIV